VRDGGFYVHGSTHPGVNGVWQVDKEALTPAPSLGTDTIDGSPLTHWEMELKVYDPFALEETFFADLPSAPLRPHPANRFPPVQAPNKPFRSGS
jgi:hypothetical protein